MLRIPTPRLTLILQSIEDVRAMLAGLSPEHRAQVSPIWLAQIAAATEPTPWLHGFYLCHQITGESIGTAGYKGPPTADGMVEIAYQVVPEHQGQGYATEAASALIAFAFQHREIKLVRAHTVPEPNASACVLSKCGFTHLGEVIDAEDGLVWRWEKAKAGG